MYLISAACLRGQDRSYSEIADQIITKGLGTQEAYAMLVDLTTSTGSRLSGSPGASKAVQWGKKIMEIKQFDKVWLEPVMVPHWVRGDTERAVISVGGKSLPLAVCALGGSIATPSNGVSGEVIEVKSLDEARSLGAKARGKIIFYNRAFDATKVSPFEAYGNAVDQRSRGTIEAGRVGATAVLVRSMTNALDDEPHTGMMNYNDSVPKIPAAAVSTVGANLLSEMLQSGDTLVLTLTLSCQTLPEVESANVIGELTGTEKPNEVVLVGGHLDSWDKGVGAHDDGAGCVQAIEVLNVLKKLGVAPKRSIRCVLFMNEENGLRGGKAYAERQRTLDERHIAAIESDAGGFSPRGFGVSADSMTFERIKKWTNLFERIGADRIRKGGGGADISSLSSKTKALIGLSPDNQRYFDYHHSNNDTLDKVHPRELELGAIAMAILSYVIAQEGL